MLHFKKNSRGRMPTNPPSDMQIYKSEEKNSWSPPLPNPGDAPACFCYKSSLIKAPRRAIMCHLGEVWEESRDLIDLLRHSGAHIFI